MSADKTSTTVASIFLTGVLLTCFGPLCVVGCSDVLDSPARTATCDDEWCLVPAAAWDSGVDGFAGTGSYLPPLSVKLTRSFWVAKTETTVSEWRALMNSSPSRYACGDTCPVFGMTFFDVLEYANRRSIQDELPSCYSLSGCSEPSEGHGRICETAKFSGPDCLGYRLPSEFEWELAAGGGARTCIDGHPEADSFSDGNYPCSFPEGIDSLPAWYCGNSATDYAGCISYVDFGPKCMGPRPVAQKPANVYGLYDMFGNATEMTGSRYTWPILLAGPGYPYRSVSDHGFDLDLMEPPPVGEDTPPVYVLRGGSFGDGVGAQCSTFRNIAGGNLIYPSVGFRLVRTVGKN